MSGPHRRPCRHGTAHHQRLRSPTVQAHQPPQLPHPPPATKTVRLQHPQHTMLTTWPRAAKTASTSLPYACQLDASCAPACTLSSNHRPDACTIAICTPSTPIPASVTLCHPSLVCQSITRCRPKASDIPDAQQRHMPKPAHLLRVRVAALLVRATPLHLRGANLLSVA
jgi:hypothetical protein